LKISKNKDTSSFCYGLLDKNFNVVLPAEYDSVSRVRENLFYAAKRNNDKFDWYKYENGNLEFLKTTNRDTSGDYDEESGSLGTYRRDGNHGYHGAVDADFNVICEPKYDNGIYFEKGYSVVQYGSTDFSNVKGIGNVYNGKFGIIDKTGNEIVKCEYDKITRPRNGGFICVKDGKRDIFTFDAKADEPKCSSWARDSIVCGNLYGIIPEEINNNFSEKITRGEFCKLAVQTYLEADGAGDIDKYTQYLKNISDDMENPFNDTNDKYIVLANHIGIVSGKGNGKFCPDDTITRQEAAVMLANMAKAMTYNLVEEKIDFVDKQYFADRARESIYKVLNFKGEENVAVMTGTGNGKFSPWYSYSREQAIATMVRIFDIRRHTFRNEYESVSKS